MWCALDLNAIIIMSKIDFQFCCPLHFEFHKRQEFAFSSAEILTPPVLGWVFFNVLILHVLGSCLISWAEGFHQCIQSNPKLLWCILCNSISFSSRVENTATISGVQYIQKYGFFYHLTEEDRNHLMWEKVLTKELTNMKHTLLVLVIRLLSHLFWNSITWNLTSSNSCCHFLPRKLFKPLLIGDCLFAIWHILYIILQLVYISAVRSVIRHLSDPQ